MVAAIPILPRHSGSNDGDIIPNPGPSLAARRARRGPGGRGTRASVAGLPAQPGKGRTVVVGAGKAAAAMAQAVERHWRGKLSGLVVTRYGHGLPCSKIEIVEASHPMPDAAGQDAAARILAAVRGLECDDLVLCLISGGASALLALPAEGISLDDKARHDAHAAALRRLHRRDQQRAKTFIRHQGRFA